GPDAEPAIDGLLALLGDAACAGSAAEALGLIGRQPGRVVPALLVHLDDDMPPPESDGYGSGSEHPIIGAVARYGAAAVPALVEALQVSPDRAAEALARIGADAVAAVPALTALLASGTGPGRRAAVNALQSIGAAAVPALVVALGEERSRGSAIDALGG